MIHIVFNGEGDNLNSSVAHRCIMVSQEVKNQGYFSRVLTRNLFFKKIPNTYKQMRNWHIIMKEKPDIIVLHRSSNIIDYYMIKKAKKYSKTIYDFDDALFHVKFPGKIISYSHIRSIIKESNAVTVGSHYLFDYSKKLNKNTFLLPTPVDIDLFHPKKKKHKKNDYVTIGWLGAGTELQLPYLRILKRPFKVLAQKYDIKFKIVSALSEKVRSEFMNLGFEVDFGLDHWVPLEKTPDLISDFDIGVMPLTDDPFSRGKCAMKALEYMAMGIPVVASAVGENKYAIKEGYNGFLASNGKEWIEKLETLILDKKLREEIGKNGRKTVEEKYSLNVVGKKMKGIINSLIDNR